MASLGKYVSTVEPNSDMRGRLTTKEDIERFIFSGKAIITLASMASGVRFTYRVNKLDDPTKDMWFVALLSGADNESDSNYQYFGFINSIREWVHAKPDKTRIGEGALSAKAWAWFIENLKYQPAKMLSQLEVWHEGRCGRCGRKLTVPESIAQGFGPECINHV